MRQMWSNMKFVTFVRNTNTNKTSDKDAFAIEDKCEQMLCKFRTNITFALRQIQINEPNCKQMCSNFVK